MKYVQKLNEYRSNMLKNILPLGTVVMLIDPAYIKSGVKRPRHEPKYIGPYTIVRREISGAYVVRDDTGVEYHRKVPVDQMKVVHVPTSPDDSRVEPEGDKLWVAEDIVDHAQPDNGLMYRVKWKGYNSSQNTWDPETNINGEALIASYYRSLSKAKLQQ